MNNKLIDLNNHLFEQIERLGDEDKVGEDLKIECMRAKAIGIIAENIISNAKLALQAEQFKQEYDADNMPTMLEC